MKSVKVFKISIKKKETQIFDKLIYKDECSEGEYMCSFTNMCISQDKVDDSVSDCTYGDDEKVLHGKTQDF